MVDLVTIGRRWIVEVARLAAVACGRCSDFSVASMVNLVGAR
jgi:hypothetical protein